MEKLRIIGKRAESLLGKKIFRALSRIPKFEEKLIELSERNKSIMNTRLREVRILKRKLENKLRNITELENLSNIPKEERLQKLKQMRENIYNWLCGEDPTGTTGLLADERIGPMQLNAFMDHLSERLAEIENNAGLEVNPEYKKEEILREINEFLYARIFSSFSELWREMSDFIELYPQIIEASRAHPHDVQAAYEAFIDGLRRENIPIHDERLNNFALVHAGLTASDMFLRETPLRNYLRKLLQAVAVDRFMGVKKVRRTDVNMIKTIHDEFAEEITGMSAEQLEKDSVRKALFNTLFTDLLVDVSKHVFEVGLRPEMNIEPWIGKELWDIWTKGVPGLREACRKAWVEDPGFVKAIISPVFLNKKGQPVIKRKLKFRVREAWNRLEDMGFTKRERFIAMKKFIQDYDFGKHGIMDAGDVNRDGSFRRELLKSLVELVPGPKIKRSVKSFIKKAVDPHEKIIRYLGTIERPISISLLAKITKLDPPHVLKILFRLAADGDVYITHKGGRKLTPENLERFRQELRITGEISKTYSKIFVRSAERLKTHISQRFGRLTGKKL